MYDEGERESVLHFALILKMANTKGEAVAVMPWLVVNAGTEIVVSEHATEAEANTAQQVRQLGSFPVYRVQKRYTPYERNV